MPASCQIDQNIYQLWPILSALTEEDLALIANADRLQRLLSHGFGLWDVLGACERAGSLDAAIRQPAANNFNALRARSPLLHCVGFDGKEAGKFATQFAGQGCRVLVLASTSPVHASASYEQKLATRCVLLEDSVPSAGLPPGA